MARLMEAAADRIAPWRGADGRILLLEGAALIAAGIYLLADGERGEFILGLVVAIALAIDGIRQWIIGFRRLEQGRSRELTIIRGAVGIITGGLILALSILQQITVIGIRVAVGVGGLVYGVLGLVLVAPYLRKRQARWTATAFDVLLILVSILLLFRSATNDRITGLLTVTAWLIIGTGLVIVLVGLARLAMLRGRSDESSESAAAAAESEADATASPSAPPHADAPRPAPPPTDEPPPVGGLPPG